MLVTHPSHRGVLLQLIEARSLGTRNSPPATANQLIEGYAMVTR